jgi:hypothetical protein
VAPWVGHDAKRDRIRTVLEKTEPTDIPSLGGPAIFISVASGPGTSVAIIGWVRKEPTGGGHPVLEQCWLRRIAVGAAGVCRYQGRVVARGRRRAELRIKGPAQLLETSWRWRRFRPLRPRLSATRTRCGRYRLTSPNTKLNKKVGGSEPAPSFPPSLIRPLQSASLL